MSTRLGWIAVLVLGLPALGSAADQTAIMQKLREYAPHLTVTRISPSPVAGIHEVEVKERGAMFYAAADGSHVIAGDMYVLSGDGLQSITELRREERRRELLAGLDADDMIIFRPEEEPQAILHVFTDVDCPYCRKLHQEISALNGYGVEVRYLAYPRAGPDSATFEKMVSAWCSDDPGVAVTDLKLGNSIPSSTARALSLTIGARRAMVVGTPTIIT